MIRIFLPVVIMLACAATLLQAQTGTPEKRRLPSRSATSPQTDSLIHLLKIPGMRWDSLLARIAAVNQTIAGGKGKDGRLLGERPPVLSRMIAGRFEERHYRFGIEDGYSLDVMTDDDTIVAASLARGAGPILRVIDTVRLRRGVTVHERIFRTRIDFSERSMLPLQLHRFGVSCGNAGRAPDEFQEMALLVQDADLEELRRWAGSLNPEFQTYGALGLLSLRARGKKLSADDHAMLEQLRRSGTLVNVCQGDLIGPLQTMSTVLAEENIPGFMMLIDARLRTLER